jgi:hypothetical protein
MKKLYGPQKLFKSQRWDKFLNPERGCQDGNNNPQPPTTQLNLPEHKYDVKGSHQIVLVPNHAGKASGGRSIQWKSGANNYSGKLERGVR